jgi:general secretion pathway protein K
MNSTHPLASRQRGTVLVTVLMMFAISAFIATEMAYRQKFDIRRTGALLTAAQTREFLGAAESLALYALNDDLRQDKQKGESDASDNLTERWAKPVPPFPVDGGSVQGILTDAQGKFNVNWLVKKGDEEGKWVPNKAGIDAFVKLLNALGVPKDPQVSATDLANRLADWMDAGDDPQPEGGFEDTEYLRTEVPRRTPNTLIRDITEIRSIEGMDLETWMSVEPYLAALPVQTRLNPYTAGAEVLSAIGVSNVAEWMQRRVSVPVPNISEVKREGDTGGGTGQTGTPDGDPSGNPAGDPAGGGSGGATGKIELTPTSQYFELHGTARLGDRILQSRSILYRPPTAGEKGDKLKVIYRRFVDPMTPPPPPTMTINGAPS